jgi:HTH-type transcriptional regulator / antitoxin HigA
MELKRIETESEYNSALTRIDELFDARPGSPEAKELDELAIIVNEYEENHYPIEEPDPVEYIKIRMEEMSMKAVNPRLSSPQ